MRQSLLTLTRHALLLCLLLPCLMLNAGRVSAQQTIKVGVYNFPPLVFINEQKQAQGLFIDMLELVAKQEGWTLDYVPGSFQENITRLASGEIDLLGSVAASEARLKLFDFTQQHLFLDWGIVYRQKGGSIETIFDLSGKRIGVLKGSIYTTEFKKLLDQFGIKADLIEKAEYKEIFADLSAKALDAGINANVSGLQLEGSYPVERTTILFSPTKIRFAVKKGSHAPLLEKLDAHFLALYADKTSAYYELHRKWTGINNKSNTLPGWIRWALAGLLASVALLVSLSMFFKNQISKKTRDLRDSETRYRELVEYAQDLVTRVDAEGRFTFVNAAAQSIFGLSSQECIGLSAFEFIHPEDRELTQKAFANWMQAQPPQLVFENRQLNRNGNVHLMQWDITANRNEHGEIIGFSSIARDITKMRRAEIALRELNEHLEDLVEERTAALSAALQQAQTANRAKSTFLSNMSHELRTPLNAVIGFSQLMARSSSLGESEKRNLDIINRSGNHLLTLINEVLELSKIEAGHIVLQEETCDINRLAHDITDMLRTRAEQAGLSLSLAVEGIPTELRVDTTKLRQILTNLLGNAIKFTTEGKVSLTLKADPAEYHLVRVHFAVRDTGIGIAPQDQGRIFEPFTQLLTHATSAGTGLGLSITRQYLQMLGSELTVESTPGQGSCFRFTLSLQLVASAVAAPSASGEVFEQSKASASHRILIVEDNVDSRFLLVQLLTPLNLVVAEAADGFEAVVMAASFKPDLIIMDWRMPKLDGLEAARQIRALNSKKPPKILMLTANAFEEQKQEALAAGIDAFLRKPLQEDELYAALEAQIGCALPCTVPSR